jgi:hypothetical protein
MRRRFGLWLGLSLSGSLVVAFAACGSDPVTNKLPPDDDAGPSRKKDSGPDPEPEDSGQPPDSGPPETRVYAHTQDTFYKFDPISRTATMKGKLSCLAAGDRLLDIAVNRIGEVYGTTDQAFIKISPIDGSCTIVAPAPASDLPNSLSFVPSGTLDATAEALVGYAFDAQQRPVRYVRINTSNGQLTDIGNLNAANAPKKYISSGDIISLQNGGNKTYLMAREEPLVTGASDVLVEIDPKTGLIKLPVIGATGQTLTYGFGYWAGKGYGFSADGRVTEINMATGSSIIVYTLQGDGGAGIPWFGAGVTTDAPVQ